jgi:hypothetical protein
MTTEGKWGKGIFSGIRKKSVLTTLPIGKSERDETKGDEQAAVQRIPPESTPERKSGRDVLRPKLESKISFGTEFRGQVFGFSKLAGTKLATRTKPLPANSEKPNTWPRLATLGFGEYHQRIRSFAKADGRRGIGKAELGWGRIMQTNKIRDWEIQGSGVRFFEIGRDKAGHKNKTASGQFRKTKHLTPNWRRSGSAKTINASGHSQKPTVEKE